MVRMYVPWAGKAATDAALGQVRDLADAPVSWDLVLAYRDPEGDIAAWTEFVDRVVGEHGDRLAAIQVTGEANLTNVPAAADGAFPGATEAFVHGVLVAAAAKRRAAAAADIGFA